LVTKELFLAGKNHQYLKFIPKVIKSLKVYDCPSPSSRPFKVPSLCKNSSMQEEGKKAVDSFDTIEGWPLPTVENEANGNYWSTYEGFASLVVSLGSSYRFKRFLSCLGCSSQPSTKYYFPNLTLFPCTPSPSNLGSG